MGTAVKTNGEGRHCITHLNLTVSLAEVWRKDIHASIRIKPTKVKSNG